MNRNSNKKCSRQKILIIGGGAAGMSCAEMLARHPDKYHVTLLERGNAAGGQSSSVTVDSSKYRAGWVNSVVQYASPDSAHAFSLLRAYGYEPQEQDYHLAIGKGKENFFTNVFPTALARRHESEIRRFGRGMKSLKRAPRVLSRIPLSTYLRMFGYSSEFAEKIIYPLAGTLGPMGNSSNDIPVGIAQWLFAEGHRNIWNYDVESSLPNISKIYTFPNMGRFFQDWADGLRSKGVQIRLNTQTIGIHQRNSDGIAVETRSIEVDPRIEEEGCRDRNITEVFDKLVFCVQADEAKRILGESATQMETLALGGVEFADDLAVMHSDSVYFQRKYDPLFKEGLCAEPSTQEEEERIRTAKAETGTHSGFRPGYCTFSYQSRPEKIEAAFDCSNLQHQFRPAPESDETELPLDRHVFQSHFMFEELKHLWTVDQINDDCIIERKWWHNPIHTWRHYLKNVPLLRCVNGTKNTMYAGGWTLVNTYEFACISGIAAAYQLGAPYEGFDGIAEARLSTYLRECHGRRYKGPNRGKNQQ